MQVRFRVAYDGTDYRGWQVQPSGPTIQGTLEHAFTTALRTPARVAGAGRTDAGVHASGQVAVVRADAIPENLGILTRSVNALTPRDIVVRDLEVVADTFDPRRQARSRQYVYRLWTDGEPSPFWYRYVHPVVRPLDVAAMSAAANTVLGSHDFAAFGAADGDPGSTTVREIHTSRLCADGPMLRYEIEGTAFLKHMVRSIVGTLLEIGVGARAPDALAVALATRDRRRVGMTAPAQGLTLTAVRY